MINVTKTFLPSFEEYCTTLKRAWDNEWITNNGELVQELEYKLKGYHAVKNLLFCGNGTVVLQMALKALDITKEVITTPFSYVATLNAILWEGCKPIFVDINPDTFCIDCSKIEAAITEDTEAILATHVYGLPCDIERIEAIAKKHKLKVIYDAAHAFGCTYKGSSLLSFGDISTCSFHATKLFHTVEGGCVVPASDEVARKLLLYRSFGHIGDEYFSIGINGKNSEFHAAMGLTILPKMHEIIDERKRISDIYTSTLPKSILCLKHDLDDFTYNYAYFPVLFESEEILKSVLAGLAEHEIYPRRYFYPSLNLLPQSSNHLKNCPVSEDVSRKVLCLPLFVGLSDAQVKLIVDCVKQQLA